VMALKGKNPGNGAIPSFAPPILRVDKKVVRHMQLFDDSIAVATGTTHLDRRLQLPSPSCLLHSPPILIHIHQVLSQTPAIMSFLGKRFGLVPPGEVGEAEALQLMCTLMDIVSEVHDTHHPLGVHLYYVSNRACRVCVDG
jgi:hypothetical protein